MIKRPRHKLLSDPKNRENRNSNFLQSSCFFSGESTNHHRPNGNIQQSFDRYTALAKEAQLLGDRVASESFLQHADHYLRLINASRKPLENEEKKNQNPLIPLQKRNNRRRKSSNEENSLSSHEELRETSSPTVL